MDIHICQSVEFEKVKMWKEAVALTRKRMSIQQLLDSGEEKKMLRKQLENYVKGFDVALALVLSERHRPLESHPNFAWSVNNEPVSSPCWRAEAVLARLALATLYVEEGSEVLERMNTEEEEEVERMNRGVEEEMDVGEKDEQKKRVESYKIVSQSYLKAIELHQEMIHQLELWKWRMPEMNRFFFQTQWHSATVAHLETLRHLSMISVGIETNLNSKSLVVVAQRAVKSATMSIVHWPDAWPNLLPLCEYVRYYFSSNLLWSEGEYGASIHRMQRWLVNNRPEETSYRFKSIEAEMEKVEFLSQERERINNGAYFDVVAEESKLISPVELIQAM
jgi:hypothetical protein